MGNSNWGNGFCMTCSVQVEGLRKFCEPCRVLSLRAARARWLDKNREYKYAWNADYARRKPAASRPAWQRWYAKRKASRLLIVSASRPPVKVASTPPARLMAYPFVFKVRDEHADLLLVNSLVPHGMPGREDVVQAAILALLEGQITIEQLRVGGIKRFVSQFRRDNYETGGYAVSLDVPRLAGGSWHDILPERETA